MLEKFCYINWVQAREDIANQIETLFLSNNQQKRYEHINAVTKRIDTIALQYGLDREKCRVSALLHDVSTLLKWEDMLLYATDNNWELCNAEISHPFLLYQRISEVIAREDFDIIDEDVLNAIAFHTTLRENPTQYEMALFVADKLEWSLGGEPPYYNKMMDGLNVSLEAACYEYVKYNDDSGSMASIHSDYAKAIRWLKEVMLWNV